MPRQRQLDAYIRVSRTAGREGDSFIAPAEQRRRIETWASANGVELIAWWEELDQSGARLDRPKFQRVLRRIADGETEGIVVADRSRFARSLVGALLAIEQIQETGGTFAAADGLDSSTPEGTLAVNVMLSFAQYELERIKASWRAATTRAVADGVHISARPPLGYVRNGKRSPLVVDPQTAPLVEELFRRRVAGESWQALADLMAERGHPMSKSGVLGLVKNPAYLGQARSGPATVNDLAHEAIVPADLWESAQPGAMRFPRNGTVGRDALLRGLATCSGCGHRLSVNARPWRDGRDEPKLTQYFCKGSYASGRCQSSAAIDTRRLDSYVERQLLDAVWGHGYEIRLEDTELGPSGLPPADVPEHPGHQYVRAILLGGERYERARTELAQAREQLERYVSLADVMDADDFKVGYDARREAVALARRRLRDLAPPDAEPDPGRLVTWEEYDLEDRRRTLRRFVERVEVAKADPARRRWQPLEERVRVVWVGEE
jgi:DNA invertase Pin-like site-specific DNA recombinase